ncbi:MAG: peptide/nickel transport system substrate-binding protein [Thermomicrobiales bacterium]|jgi:peptide/nickel transport system substrate-binding protein|nr:peptide/nickel transport system substrate-binding protein [Thermomicrobiales bacterium]
MMDNRISDLVERLSRGELSRRDFVKRSVAAGVSASAVATVLARHASASPGPSSKRVNSRAQVDARTLVVTDNLPAQNWLYMDPAKIYEINPAAAHNLLYETLYHLPDGTKLTDFQPLLAEAMPEFSADGLTATIKVKQNVKFHNTGNVMTASDWVFSWNRLANVKGNPSFLFTDNLVSVEAPDPATLKLTLKAPNAALVPILSAVPFSVMDSAAVKANGGTDAPDADQTDKATDWINTGNSAGTGPFRLTVWDPANEVRLEAFADYWGDKPQLDRVIFRNVADPNTALQLIETGEADIAFAVDPDAVQRVKDNPELQLLEGASLAHEYLALQTDPTIGGPLAKKEVRQAIGYAIDYDGIINGLLSGGAIHPATVVPLGLLGADEVQALGYTTDLAKAQQLFDTAAVGEVEITLAYGANQATPAGLLRDTLAAKLKSDIEQIKGLTVKIAPMDPVERLAKYRAGELQFTMSDWAPDYPDVHAYAQPFGHSVTGAAAKRVHYSNPQADQLLDQAIQELDPEKRKQMYVDVQKMMIDDAAFLVEFQPTYRSPASKKVQGAQPHGVYILQLRYVSKTE